MRKKVIIWVYEEDKEILKHMNGSIAQAVNTLLHGKKEELQAIIEEWGQEYINPKIEQIKKTLREALSVEIERRFKELNKG